ncbi:MAG: rhamnulokinase [Verrucomicrobia bacterium]|nr:rhamnulokinase [Verrucomicrobiota bacterium]
MITRYLGCDLGAESGRLMLGVLESGKLRLEEIHRFPNKPIQTESGFFWNLKELFAELERGLEKAGALKAPIAGISADSWGVDYVLYDESGAIMEPVFHYRDKRNEAGVKRALERISWEELFAETGLQFLPFNTVFQLAAEDPERLRRARRIAGIGDAFNHWLGGKLCYEESLASTTQLYDPRRGRWSEKIIRALGYPEAIFPEVVPSGAVLGELRPELASRLGSTGTAVAASCSHDTGAAVAAVPGVGTDWAYLSSGTWSLMGVELPEPVITDRCRELNFTNELGYGRSVRLLKNIIGLWIIQECRRQWARDGRDYDYAELTRMAEAEKPFAALIDPADPRYLPPGGMPERIAAACRETGQPVPETLGAIVRCVLESLALLYRRVLRQLESLLGRKIARLHIVGGGSKNELLNQFTANALQVPVLTGPAEATATGNMLVQAIALGHVESLAAARQIVRESFPIRTVEPRETAPWEEAAARFEKLFPEQGGAEPKP